MLVGSTAAASAAAARAGAPARSAAGLAARGSTSRRVAGSSRPMPRGSEVSAAASTATGTMLASESAPLPGPAAARPAIWMPRPGVSAMATISAPCERKWPPHSAPMHIIRKQTEIDHAAPVREGGCARGVEYKRSAEQTGLPDRAERPLSTSAALLLNTQCICTARLSPLACWTSSGATSDHIVGRGAADASAGTEDPVGVGVAGMLFSFSICVAPCARGRAGAAGAWLILLRLGPTPPAAHPGL